MVVTVLIVSLCFFAVPIRVGPSKFDQDLKLFKDYVVQFNKSYRHNPDEYDKRFERFQVSAFLNQIHNSYNIQGRMKTC